MKKLQFLIPYYEEELAIIKRLLDSIECQAGIDMSEIGAIIVNDGGKKTVPTSLLNKYSFDIKYEYCPHAGVSATRNKALDLATAEYVMFCDADDSFLSMVGVYNILLNIEANRDTPFDCLTTQFVEEVKTTDETGKVTMQFVDHNSDATFVHGKIYRRQYLVDNDLKFDPTLLVNEDSYFVSLVNKSIEANGKGLYLNLPLYLWRWREGSVARKDKYYRLTTLPDLCKAQTAYMHQLIERNLTKDIFNAVMAALATSYWRDITEENWQQDDKLEKYRTTWRQMLKNYYTAFSGLINLIPAKTATATLAATHDELKKTETIIDAAQATISFDDWLKFILENY